MRFVFRGRIPLDMRFPATGRDTNVVKEPSAFIMPGGLVLDSS